VKEVAQHLADVLSLGRPLAVTEVPLAQARGLTLGADVPARLSIPPFTNSAMDGFAIRAADVQPGISLPVLGDIPAGCTTPPPLRPGTALRIMTGAPLPPGADAILQVEFTENSDQNMLLDPPESITPTAVVCAGTHIRRAGEDITAGSLAFQAGTVLTPAHLSALAALGYATVPVHARPRVGVLTTGDELRAPGADLRPGQIPDSNSLLVAQLVEERNAVASLHHWAGDDPAAFSADLDELAQETDMIITTGGVSAGAFDVVKAALTHRGVRFEKVRMQPGKPQGWGVLRGGGGGAASVSGGSLHAGAAMFNVTDPTTSVPTAGSHSARVSSAAECRSIPILCLPGNPVSVFVSMQLFALPLIDELLGRATVPYEMMFKPAKAAVAWERKPGRVQFLPCVRVGGNMNMTEEGGAVDGAVAAGEKPVTAGEESVAVREGSAVAAGEVLGVPRIAPAAAGGSGSHLIGSLPHATGLARVAADVARVAAGDDVDVLWFRA